MSVNIIRVMVGDNKFANILQMIVAIVSYSEKKERKEIQIEFTVKIVLAK